MKTIQNVIGKHGRMFSVGEMLPENTYEHHKGMIATIVNDNIPEGIFIIIRKHKIIEIIDVRDGSEERIHLDLAEKDADAIGLNDHDFEANSHLSVTFH